MSEASHSIKFYGLAIFSLSGHKLNYFREGKVRMEETESSVSGEPAPLGMYRFNTVKGNDR